MKRTILYAVLAFGTMAVSCSESGLEGPRKPGTPNATPVTVALSSVAAPVPVEASGDRAAVKSVADLTEGAVDGQVHDLWAIQYDAGGNLVGTPYYTADIPSGTPSAAGSGTDYSYDGLSVQLTSSGTAAHTVYFVANTHNGSLFTVDNDVTTLDKFKAVTMGFGDEYRPTAAGGIVMMGTYTGTVASGTPLTGVKLERLAAKVVLKYKVSVSGLTVTGVQLKNVPSAFGFADAPTGNDNFPAVAAGSHIDYPADDPAKAVTEGDYRKFVWYMPENISRAVASVGAIGDRTLDKSDGRPAYVEVTGLLKTDDRVRKAVYRILLGDPSVDMGNFQVKRNHIYTVTLDIQGLNEGDNRVTVESFDMSNSAMIQPAAVDGAARDSVTFDIRKCLYNGFTTAADLDAMLGASSPLTAAVLWQDGDVIAPSDVRLDTENGLLTVRCSKTKPGNAVVALYPDANKAQGTALWSWHIWVTTYSPSGIVKNMSGPLTPNTAYPNASAGGQVHTYGAEYMKVNPGKVIMDRNLGATKSYNGRVPAAGDATADQAFGMFYQWGRKDPFPRIDGATIDVVSSVGKIITIYGQDGATPLVEDADGFKTMKTSEVPHTNNTTLEYAVKNPLTFIYSYNWFASNQNYRNDDLWGDMGPKSAYDPCPKGWRVPPIGTWDNFTRDASVPLNGTFPYYSDGQPGESYIYYKQTNGRSYNNMAWYPGEGVRRNDGTLFYTGHEGSVWSSSVRGLYSWLLYFNTGNVYNMFNTRSIGMQVRCVQE